MQQPKPRTERPCELQKLAPGIFYFWLWLIGFFLFILIVAVAATAWGVNQTLRNGPNINKIQKEIVNVLIEFPDLIKNAVKEFNGQLTGEPRRLLIVRASHEKPNWIHSFPRPTDTGYLLFSGVDPVEKQSLVQLIRVADGAVVAKWVPDWPAIYAQHTAKTYGPIGSPRVAMATSPFLLPDGDIIFNTDTSLVRLSTCSHKPVWVLDKVMHHSVDLDPNGTLWIPSVSQEGLKDNAWLNSRMRDDALANVSLDGKIIKIYSFASILRENDLFHMIGGMSGTASNDDPIHMNQIRIANRDSKYWKRGDLLISARHLSTVFLYRPKTGKIIWYQTGPWMNQHSVNFVGDHSISIYDNNNLANAPIEHAFLTTADTNRIIIYDFDNGRILQPYAQLLAKARPVTLTGGVARVLPDGGLFIEESNYGRHLFFSREELLWSRVNYYNDRYIGAVSGSFYLTAAEAMGPLEALAAQRCPVI